MVGKTLKLQIKREESLTLHLLLTAPKALREEERKRIFLLPGDVQVSRQACELTTILGSCVAVCLWDERLNTGGMNHFLLPQCTNRTGNSMRFGNLAIQRLLQELLESGCLRRNLRAKIFGGAALFRNGSNYELSLGAKNVALAESMLNNARIPIMARDTGGQLGRKIKFNTDDGTTWVKQI